MSIVMEAYLFQGISKTAQEHLRDIAERKSCSGGTFLFRGGDPAEVLYVLEEGRVRLRAGEGGQIAYVLSEPGEVFGWSSVVGQRHYTLSAECVVPVQVSQFEKKALLHVLERDTHSGMIFFRHLSELIAHRLVNAYQATLSVQGERDAQSYG